MDFSSFGKLLMVGGVVLFALGALMAFGPKIPFLGHLPGDIYVERKGFGFSFPIVTCIVVSVIGTIILNVFFRK